MGFYLDRITSADNDASTSLYPNGWDPDPALRTGDALFTPDTTPDNRQRTSGTDADIAGFNSFEEYYAAIISAIDPQIQATRNFRIETLENGEKVDVSDLIRGLNSTQDFVAEGVEIDIVGKVTDNFTLSLNLTQQQTVTSNTALIAIPLAFDQPAIRSHI